MQKIDLIQKQAPELIKRLPGIAKVEGLRFIADNFAAEGFEKKTGSYKAWPATKKAKNKKILIGEKRGGSLKRSWQQDSLAVDTRTEFSSMLPHAGVHNDGLQAGRPPGFIMPQRQMIGESEALFDRIEKKVDKMVDEVLK